MAIPKPVYVLGTGLSHDGSACLLKDGKICVAIEKERITRIKHDGFNDTAAIQYCLDAEQIHMSDLSLIVQNANFGMFEFGSKWFNGARLVENDMPLVTISHHLAHAYGAFATSPFDKAAILIIDGCGNGFDECVDIEGAFIPEVPRGELAYLWFEKDSYYSATDRQIKPIYKDFSPLGEVLKHYPIYPPLTRHSIGGLYAGVSSYIFRGLDDSGKLMGLAPYGRPNIYDFEVFELRDGRLFLRYNWMDNFRNPAHSDEDFKSNFQEYADLAYWVQKEVERAILYILRSRYDLFPTENLCYAGGVALNAVANSRILAETPFKRVYIQPAAGDNGIAVGCAYYGWLGVLGHEKQTHAGSTSFGRGCYRDQIEKELEKYGELIEVKSCEDYVEEAASLLAQSNVLAWFQGRSEFGPRALGNRSILADPRLGDIKAYINETVKFREEFRPFAPAVILEDASLYFDIQYESPYMLLVALMRPEWRSVIPSVVHRDGSSRIQTVTESLAPEFYRLLKEFKRLTGIGVLLNTSLNKRKMPIVETPAEALSFFLSSGIHALVIDHYVVRKRTDLAANAFVVPGLLTVEIRNLIQDQLSKDPVLSGFSEFQVRQIQICPIGLPQSDDGRDGKNTHTPTDVASALSQTLRTRIPEFRQKGHEVHLGLSAILSLKRR